MTGQRAGRRIHLRRASLLTGAALLALLAALFASAAPTQAAPGDVSHTVGFCSTQVVAGQYFVGSSGNTGATGYQVRNENNEWVNIPCPQALGAHKVTVTPNGTATPEVKKLEPQLLMTLSEAFVTPGTDVMLTIELRDGIDIFADFGASGGRRSTTLTRNSAFKAAATTGADLDAIQGYVRLDYLHTSGALPNPAFPPGTPALNTDTSDYSHPRLDVYSYTFALPVPLGTPAGEYTISMSLTFDEVTGDNWPGLPGNPYRMKTVKNEVVLTVVDTLPVFVADAAIALGNASEDDPRTVADDLVAEDGTEPADGGDISVRITALNEFGEQSADGQVSQLQVFAVGGAVNEAAGGATISGGDALGQTDVTITKPDKQAGTVEVYAIVIGSGGVAETERLTLTFTGAPAALTLGGDVRVGQPAEGATSEAEVALSATDAAGNDVPPGTVSYQVTDADGNAVAASMISVDTSTAGSSTMTTRDDSNAPIALVMVSPSAEPGAYTITASLPDVDDSADTATVHVAGPVASLEVSADPASATMVSEVVTVTAMVTDAAGVAVADGESVTFTLTGGPLVLVGADADSMTAGHQSLTSDGAASAKFVVIGSGAAVIAASSGGQSAVVVVASEITAGSAEGEPAAAPSASDCTRGMIGFVTWTCSQPSTAAAVMAELARRGATAIYLYDPVLETWTGYAMVDGKVVPGSVDFTIIEGDIIYVSL